MESVVFGIGKVLEHVIGITEPQLLYGHHL